MPRWIAARRQTAGRGRLGRSWQSADGNLFCTALFLESGGFEVATRLPFAAALAVADTVGLLAPGAPIGLKWPNDVRAGGAKLSGILVEAGQAGGGTAWVAVGIGVNVARAPEAGGRPTTCLAALRGDTVADVDAVLEALRARFAVRLGEARNDFASIRAAWLARSDQLGEVVRVEAGHMAVEGVFEGLAEDGGLVLRLPDATTRIIRAGDVELVREGPPSC